MRSIILLLVLVFTAPLAHADDSSTLRGNVTVESVDAAQKLAGVSRIVGNLVIQNYDGADLSALRSLTMIEGSLIISNSKLTSLSGLGALERVYGIIWIFSNPKLTSLGALARLRAAQQALTVTDNPSLTSLLPAGITIGEPIKKIRGSLTIRNNTALPAAVASTFAASCKLDGKVEVQNNGR